MSDRLCFDKSWSLSLPKQPELRMVPPCRITPDARFEPQIYLESFSQVQPNKVLGILAQAVESDDAKSVSIHKMLEKNIPTGEQIHEEKKNHCIQFCIDEVASKLYLVFLGTKQDRRGEKSFHLFVSSLSFGEPDRFGHRRVTLSGDDGMYKINFGEILIKALQLSPQPKTGELLFFVIGKDQNMLLQANGKLDLNGVQSRTIDAQILAKFNFGLLHMVDMCSVRFINKGKRLAVFNWSAQKFLLTLPNELAEESLVHLYSLAGSQFKLEQVIACDQLAMIAYIYPPASRLDYSNSNCIAESVRRGINFVGHMFKYTVFSCADGVALVKNFYRCIEADLCKTKTRRSFLSFEAPDLFWEIQPVFVRKLSVQYALGSILYYMIEMNNRIVLHRLELGGQFKDYRTCACCGIQETNKRHNVHGKRIAYFKVCRECKKLNLHHQWWMFPCHFCSDKCMKKGWKGHKKIHRE